VQRVRFASLRLKKIILRAPKIPKLAYPWPPDIIFKQLKFKKKSQVSLPHALPYAQIALLFTQNSAVPCLPIVKPPLSPYFFSTVPKLRSNGIAGWLGAAH